MTTLIDFPPSGFRLERNDSSPHLFECPKALKMQQLADTFPSLRVLHGINPWDMEHLLSKEIPHLTGSTRHALLFVLSVWDPNGWREWNLEPFDLHAALQSWNRAHRRAFLLWAQSPFWVGFFRSL